MTFLKTLAAGLCAGFLLSCVSSTGNTQQDLGPWVLPSPSLRQQIDQQSARLPWSRGLERVEIIRWFAGVGEPATTQLDQ